MSAKNATTPQGYGMSEVSAFTTNVTVSAVSSTTARQGGYIAFAEQKYRIYESKYIEFAKANISTSRSENTSPL